MTREQQKKQRQRQRDKKHREKEKARREEQGAAIVARVKRFTRKARYDRKIEKRAAARIQERAKAKRERQKKRRADAAAREAERLKHSVLLGKRAEEPKAPAPIKKPAPAPLPKMHRPKAVAPKPPRGDKKFFGTDWEKVEEAISAAGGSTRAIIAPESHTATPGAIPGLPGLDHNSGPPEPETANHTPDYDTLEEVPAFANLAIVPFEGTFPAQLFFMPLAAGGYYVTGGEGDTVPVAAFAAELEFITTQADARLSELLNFVDTHLVPEIDNSATAGQVAAALVKVSDAVVAWRAGIIRWADAAGRK